MEINRAARIFGLGATTTSNLNQEEKGNDVQTSEETVDTSVQEETAEVAAETVATDVHEEEEVSAEEPIAEAEEESVYITPGIEWRTTMKKLEEQIEEELGKANAVVSDIVSDEKAKCKALAEEQYKAKEAELVSAHESEVAEMKEQYESEISSLREEVEKLSAGKEEILAEVEAKHKEEMEEATAKQKEECDAELEKMKNLYAQQLDEVQEAFREKSASFRKEIDRYKEQIEVLMLHIDDPFVLQEMEMKQTQEAAEIKNEAAEG